MKPTAKQPFRCYLPPSGVILFTEAVACVTVFPSCCCGHGGQPVVGSVSRCLPTDATVLLKRWSSSSRIGSFVHHEASWVVKGPEGHSWSFGAEGGTSGQRSEDNFLH